MLTAQQVAERLGLDVRTVYDLAKSGRLKCYRFGRKAVRFDERDVQEFKELCRSTTTAGTSATASRSTVSFKVTTTDIAAFFQKAGVKPKLTPTTARKRRDSTHLQLVSES